ncbi:hypothetical protein BH10PAT3_BH10PAT3_7470 [soil metagenome]
MLAIRMQRTGRKGHAQFRVIVQESRRSPSSGNVVAALGSYDPHTKAITLDKEKAAIFLGNGAQPSPRVAALLQKEGVKLPSWVKIDTGKKRAIKNTDKLRRNRPEEPKAEVEPTEAVAEVADAVPPTEEAESAVADTTTDAEAESSTAAEAEPESKATEEESKEA